VFEKRPVTVLVEGDPQFLLRVHHDRAVPGDRFADGLAGDEQEADLPVPRGDGDLFSIRILGALEFTSRGKSGLDKGGAASKPAGEKAR
jgi:hypothetical protein